MNPQTVRFRYKAAAKWSDGTQITGKDFRFLVSTIMAKDGANFRLDITSRTGYPDIKSAQGNGKQVTSSSASPTRPGKGSSPRRRSRRTRSRASTSNQLSRNHTLNPKTKKQVEAGCTCSRAGSGRAATVAHNPNYWGKQRGSPNHHRQVPNMQTQFQALRAGEPNMNRPQFQTAIAEIQKDKCFTVQIRPRYQREHSTSSRAERDSPRLNKLYVRKAITTAINLGEQIANNLFKRRLLHENLPRAWRARSP